MLESSFIYDLPNLLVCLVTLVIIKAWCKLPNHFLLLLTAHCFIPFFLNDVLFPTSYMGDQFRYIFGVQEIRETGELTRDTGTVASASWILSFLPLPLVMTTQSLGFFNKFIFIVMFGFLYKKKILNNFSSWFLLLYPSVILYTGLSLRDTLIVFFMVLATFAAVKRNVSLFVLSMCFLWFIKFQNLLIMLPLVYYLIFNLSNGGMKVSRGIVFVVFLVTVLLAASPIAIPIINKFRLAMYIEDGGDDVHDVALIAGVSDFIITGIQSGFYFFVKPFPWEASSLLQLIQSLENLVIMLLVIKLTLFAWGKDKKHLMFWLVLFVSSMLVYGLVVFNYGTAARYRFPFIVIYVVFVSYKCGIKKFSLKSLKFK